jgi:hypothetical protein
MEYLMKEIFISILPMVDQRHPLGPEISVLENMYAGKSVFDGCQSAEGTGEAENWDPSKTLGMPEQQRQIPYFLRVEIAAGAACRQEPSV